MYASQKFQGFSTFRGPETHIRYAQGHQRESALTGSINNMQNTNITVTGAEHQKTVDTKFGKQTICFPEVIKVFYHYLQEK